MRTVVVTDSSGRPSRPSGNEAAVVVVPITILLADRQVPTTRSIPGSSTRPWPGASRSRPGPRA